MKINNRVIVLREAIVKIVQILAARKCRVTQQGTRAFCAYRGDNLERVNIPYIPDDASDELLDAVQGFVDHELGHVLFTDPKALHEAKKKGCSQLHNVIEDTFVERKMSERFTGAASNLGSVFKFYVLEHSRQKMKEGKFMDALIVPAFRAWAGQAAAEEYMKDKWHHIQPVVDKLGKDMPGVLRGIQNSFDSIAAAETVRRLMEVPEEGDMGTDGAEFAEGEGEGESNPFSDPKTKPGGEPQVGEGADKPETEETADEKGKPQPSESEEGKSKTKKKSAPKAEKKAGDEGKEKKPEAKKEGEPKPKSESEEKEAKSKPDAEKKEPAPEKDESKSAAGPETESEPDADADEEKGGGEKGEDEEDGADGEGEDGDEGEGDDGAGDADGAGDGDADADADADGGGEKDEGGGEGSERSIGADGGSPLTKELEKAAENGEYDKALADAISEKAAAAAEDTDYLIFTQDYDRIEVLDRHCDDAWLKNLQDEVDHMVGPIQKDLERAVAARSAAVWTGGHRSGRLHSASLHRLQFDRSDVFRRKEINDSKSVAVEILIDISGSMTMGGKLRLATYAGYALASVLDRLNIPNEAICFSTTSFPTSALREMASDPMHDKFARLEALNMPILKRFDERVNTAVKSRFAALHHSTELCANNVDGECVQIAARRVGIRREKRKILIVLYDGHPACSGNWRAQLTHIKAVVPAIEKAGIDVVGIGIKDEAVKQFYKHHVVLHDIKDLPGEVLRQLRTLLLEAKVARAA